MSIERKETITCPECGQEQDFTVWQTLNGDIDSEAKKQLLEGTLFQFKCAHCGYESDVNYPMLYHDMQNKVMIYFTDEDSVEEALETMTNAEKQKDLAMPGYRKRIVTDQNVLREKAIIFDQELDDRVIEIIKLFYYSKVSEQVPEANIHAVYFFIANGKFILEFVGDKPLSTEVPVSMYEDIKRDFAEQLKAEGDADAVIDIYWASEFLKG